MPPKGGQLQIIIVMRSNINNKFAGKQISQSQAKAVKGGNSGNNPNGNTGTNNTNSFIGITDAVNG